MCAVKERFVEKPNLPESKVTTAAVSGAYPEILEALKAHGIRCVTTEFDTRLPDPIAYHADMQMFHLDKGRTFVLRGEEALKKQLTDIGYQVAETAMTPEPKYPKDVLCNMLNLNGTVLANLGVMDPNIYTCLEDAGLKMRHVNQGYTRCATAVVAKDAIITMDLGIRALAQFLGHRRAACARRKRFSGWLRLRLLRRLLWPDRQKCVGVHRQARFFRVRGGDSCVSRKALRTVH